MKKNYEEIKIKLSKEEQIEIEKNLKMFVVIYLINENMK